MIFIVLLKEAKKIPPAPPCCSHTASNDNLIELVVPRRDSVKAAVCKSRLDNNGYGMHTSGTDSQTAEQMGEVLVSLPACHIGVGGGEV